MTRISERKTLIKKLLIVRL